jgi:hypothetical protein
MTLAALLLRLLLAFTLAFNGASSAVAATEMVAEHAAGSTMPTAVPPPHAGCHGHMAAAPAQQAAHGHEDAGSGHRDCCGVGACACACAQLPALEGFTLFVQPPALPLERFAARVAATRQSPALPLQTRPPIV